MAAERWTPGPTTQTLTSRAPTPLPMLWLTCKLLELSAGRQIIVNCAYGSFGTLLGNPPAGMCHKTVLRPRALWSVQLEDIMF